MAANTVPSYTPSTSSGTDVLFDIEPVSQADALDLVVEEPEPVADPIRVIPLSNDRDKDGDWPLYVPPAQAIAPATKRLKALRDEGKLNLSDEHIDALAKAAVDPKELASTNVTFQRVDNGWFQLLELRLFTPNADVSLANDRWVADIIYAADPATKSVAPGRTVTAVPMPEPHATYAALVYGSDAKDLITAAEANFRHVLDQNRQDVGRRLIGQPLTLTPTIVDTGKKGTNPLSLWTTSDGNCRVSSALDRLHILPEWLPEQLRTAGPYASAAAGKAIPLTPTILMNLTVAEKRALVRKIAKASSDRLKQPEKSESERGFRRDRTERNAAAAAINALTAPARVVVGWIDDDTTKGTSRFASAVRSLLVQLNVEGQPLDAAARGGVSAEELVADLHAAGLITNDEFEILVGRSDITSAMTNMGLDSTLPDLRAAVVMQVLTRGDAPTRRVMRNRLSKGRGGVQAKHRDAPVIELSIRSYSATLDDRGSQVRNALEAGPVWQGLIDREWQVLNINTDEKVDGLAEAARMQVTGGPAQRLLGVLGLYALVTTGNLLAPGGSAEAYVGDQPIDRGRPGAIVAQLITHDWGIDLLADAIKRSRHGAKLRYLDEHRKLVEVSPTWTGAIFSAHLRRAVKVGSLPPATIPGTQAESVAWTKFAASVVDSWDNLNGYRDLRSEAGTLEKLSWSEVKVTVDRLRRMASWVPTIAEAETADAEL
ncbi:hypothetical protein BH09ACT12_BH09ACT12_04930 [soil metagenome]